MAMNIHVDRAIFGLQSNGGVSRLWRSLLPALQKAMPDASFDDSAPAELFLSTYYRMPPEGMKSIVMVYDFIHEHYPLLGRHHPDAVDKRRAIARADAVIGISQYTADDAMTFCGKPASVAYCGGGETFKRAMPAEVKDFKRRYGLDNYVIVVGRRGLYKNVQALYQAWRLWPAHKHFKILCVGGEEQLPQDIGFQKSFPGQWMQARLSDADLSAAYTGAYALVYPSLFEGFGLPPVEAMACGCPVITSAGGSVPEVVGDAALVVNVFRPLEIAHALNALADPALCLELALRGYPQARQFTWANMAESLASVIRGVA